MKIALLDYSHSNNIGDHIQSLAVAQHLDQEYVLVDRESLSEYAGEPVIVAMNGWFTKEPENWPPSPSITPIFFSFHMTAKAARSFEKHKSYFERFAPIGCRDQATADTFKSWGVEAYVSGCATMTFPSRKAEPEKPKIILVDQSRRHFPRSERGNFVNLTHKFPRYLSSSVKFGIARDLLQFYRNRGGLVVTSRIHCAMPCAAMGIPVVYTGVKEGRTDIIDVIDIPKLSTRRFPRSHIADLPLRQPSFERLKQQITADLHFRLKSHGVKVRNPPQGRGKATDSAVIVR
ncbi:MAG: hypothetical protein BGN87_04550 [Rhizobiales bacterium 65-79]|mgnify:CR=1 FL=1|nr:polysaccharide pyruvyl transferase family protein [Hyphomicrobiales bacterium]OJU00307.1 MAG: hypothetical protein BGN87_04550 [Rhizobiales bacterium 65-79]